MFDVRFSSVHVSDGVYDAWKVAPPCELVDSFCHVDCPYFYECNSDDSDDLDFCDELDLDD